MEAFIIPLFLIGLFIVAIVYAVLTKNVNPINKAGKTNFKLLSNLSDTYPFWNPIKIKKETILAYKKLITADLNEENSPNLIPTESSKPQKDTLLTASDIILNDFQITHIKCLKSKEDEIQILFRGLISNETTEYTFNSAFVHDNSIYMSHVVGFKRVKDKWVINSMTELADFNEGSITNSIIEY